MTVTKIKIGVLILPPVQLLDMAPVDLFHMTSKQYLTECNLPQPFIDLGVDTVSIHYIAEEGPPPSTSDDVKLAELTAKAAVRITDSFTSPSVQPGNLDILFVPGPDPSLTPSPAAQSFMRSHATIASTTIMSVCTGIIPLGYAGILDNKTVTGPRALINMMLRKKFPKAQWTERRWETDGTGRLWTSGGITNGQDMVAAYLKTSGNFSYELADLVCAMADVGSRGQEYGRGGAGEGAFWGWLLLRSWVKGIFTGGTRERAKNV